MPAGRGAPPSARPGWRLVVPWLVTVAVAAVLVPGALAGWGRRRRRGGRPAGAAQVRTPTTTAA